MRQGRPPAPTLSLAPSFRAAIVAYDLPLWALAELSGFPHYPNFSRVLRAPRIPATRLTTARLRRLADRIRYPGPLFEEEAEVQP